MDENYSDSTALIGYGIVLPLIAPLVNHASHGKLLSDLTRPFTGMLPVKVLPWLVMLTVAVVSFVPGVILACVHIRARQS
ncbi:hypothetical protein CEB3_c19140 [Peptococcaceae bacterium CEB3]|nr:hypothetical protein CEB3_c19140 [Peptococcaceae bacterium CEB3]